MKILINGNSIGEIVEAKISKKDVVVLSDTVEITKADITLFDRAVGHSISSECLSTNQSIFDYIKPKCCLLVWNPVQSEIKNYPCNLEWYR